MSYKPFNFSDFEMTGSDGIDALFAREPSIGSPVPKDVPHVHTATCRCKKASTGRRKVSSLGDISSFVRFSGDQLIHKSERDLWSLKKEADGSFYIERLFDDNGEPLKG